MYISKWSKPTVYSNSLCSNLADNFEYRYWLSQTREHDSRSMIQYPVLDPFYVWQIKPIGYDIPFPWRKQRHAGEGRSARSSYRLIKIGSCFCRTGIMELASNVIYCWHVELALASADSKSSLWGRDELLKLGWRMREHEGEDWTEGMQLLPAAMRADMAVRRNNF
jgi:hypothetical protein